MPDRRRTEIVCYRSLRVRMSGRAVAAMAGPEPTRIETVSGVGAAPCEPVRHPAKKAPRVGFEPTT
jgi:hypothetical protein